MGECSQELCEAVKAGFEALTASVSNLPDSDGKAEALNYLQLAQDSLQKAKEEESEEESA